MPFIDDPRTTYRKVNLDAAERLDNSYQVKMHSFAKDLALDVSSKVDVIDVDCINQSISNILLTIKTERLFNLYFGTDLYQYLFQNFDTTDSIRSSVYRSIISYEKRIVLTQNDIQLNVNEDEHYIELNIKYLIKESNVIGEWSDKLYV